MKGGFVCMKHGGKAPQVMAKAQERLEAHYPRAVQVIGELINASKFPTVQLGACKLTIEHKDGRPTERIDATVRAVGQMSDEELRARALALVEETPKSQ